MDFESSDMVQCQQPRDATVATSQCAVFDKTPNSEQQKINIIVRPTHTVDKVIKDITTQYPYKAFDLVLQPVDERKDLVYLNDCRNDLIYNVKGFDPKVKNSLVLLPLGLWQGPLKQQRYDLSLKRCYANGNSSFSAQDSVMNNNNNNNNHFENNHYNNINSTSMNHENECITTTANIGGNSTTIVSSAGKEVTSTAAASLSDSLHLSPMSDVDNLSDDDLALGASASPTEAVYINVVPPKSVPFDGDLSSDFTRDHSISMPDPDYDEQKISSTIDDVEQRNDSKYPLIPLDDDPLVKTEVSSSCTEGNGYVGLVNQAMTCYLNSLLQALYMTPEFRNALYRWESDNDNEAKNIPYQLQKLFLHLQTSKKSAVETTDLTRSFGWDSTEAWQQHDIQELCRVMFDALEHKFKNTKQAHLISTLYEGKMIDYVKCLECNTEKTRADTLLDIPLPVRPFGSSVAYGSIEEALRAFVQPETLDGNNQYFCEKCNKKCDAHKGLKFKNFPYILTLHLKRFDFDYQTMHRIKLNDKVTFPQTLNLNSFINNDSAATANGFVLNGVSASPAANTGNNQDDCSTTDSGSAMEEDNCSSGIATTASSQHENDMNDEDEGIDMSSSTDHRVNGGCANTTAIHQRLKHEAGPFIYELFAIMIHSGSASGGHYYAYIKEFDNNEWFCFNDQTVTPITEEDIQKSFGGSTTKAYYSSVYSSSTNAYMLMYRQIDPKRNERSTKSNDFPKHIQTLLPKLQAEDEQRGQRHTRRRRDYSSSFSDLALPDSYKPRVHFYDPTLKKLKMVRIHTTQNFDLNMILESAHQRLNVEQFAPVSRCRLVGYDQTSDDITQSFEPNANLTELRDTCYGSLDFLLEYAAEGQVLDTYTPGGNTWFVYMVNWNIKAIDGPYLVHSQAHECNEMLRRSIAVRLFLNEQQMVVTTLGNRKAFVAYDPIPTPESDEFLATIAKTHFNNITHFFVNVPSTEVSNLEYVGIPSFEAQLNVDSSSATAAGSDVVDAMLMCSPNSTAMCDISAQGTATTPQTSLLALPAESNSEDSSLSDGDRTLVESVQHRGGGDSSPAFSSCGSRSPQLSQMSGQDDEEQRGESASRIQNYINGPSIPAYSTNTSGKHLFFHAIKLESIDTISSISTCATQEESAEMARKPVSAYKILVDSRMKMAEFHKRLELLIKVPAAFFKITRKHETEPLNPADMLLFITEGETLQIELGKTLERDEHKAKIYFMRVSELTNETGKLPCVCEWSYKATMTVVDAKKDLVAKLKRMDAEKYNSLSIDNCRLWLKGGRVPIKIFAEDETLGFDGIVPEYLIQECEGDIVSQPSDDCSTIFVRRWHPDRLELGPFQEITWEKDNELRNVISKLSGIPEEHLVYNKMNSSFPCTNISLLSINGSMNWSSDPSTLDKGLLATTTCGNVYFYKDNRDTPKELTPSERREFNAKEKTRLDQLGCSSSTSYYSPRRERALKIYLDSPQAESKCIKE